MTTPSHSPLRTTRADRMAQPTTRDAVRAVAENHGACLRPIQLRRTNTATGEVDQVLIPCGATLADICPPCADRAKDLRAAQCREGWHLEAEPIPGPPPPDEVQAMWVEHRARAQADHAARSGEDTAELDELIADLDQEIKRSGLRGNADPGRPKPRRQRSTRRRQDVPDLPKRKISPRTVGRTYTAPDGKTFRPSMFITLTCPSYGKVAEDGTPADPRSYDYQQAARDALHFAALFDRFIQNLRRVLGYDVQYFAPSSHRNGSRRTCTSPSAVPSPGPSCGRSLPLPTTRSGGHRPKRCGSRVTTCQCGTRRRAAISIRRPASC
jgi:Replication initiator protein, pSAM2